MRGKPYGNRIGHQSPQTLFEYLDKAAAGETIVIQRNNQEVARIVPTLQHNWRQQMTIEPKILVP
ncbi:MAG: hypothetical protein R2911_12690 [Caldilineaceae bacterium]